MHTVAVAGTRLWAETRARRVLENAGWITVGADDRPSDLPPDLVVLIRTDNSPVPTSREAQVLARIPEGVALIVAGRVGFHPFEHRVAAEVALDGFSSADLSAVAGEVRRLVPSPRRPAVPDPV